ncbi:MAG: carbohydrate-binding module family 20 domain-containing protein [Candidatus Bathyarchaeota archaeon]
MEEAQRCRESDEQDKALSLCDAALGIDEKCYTAWLLKGAIYSTILNRLEDALHCYDKAIAILRGLTTLSLAQSLALTTGSNKIFDDLQTTATQADFLDTARLVAWYNKALILEKLGKNEDALSCYDALLKTGKADDLASSQKARLLQLMDGTDKVKVTFNLHVPHGSDTVYIAGSFNNWNPEGLRVERSQQNDARTITVHFLEGQVIEYKYTRGSWQTVETMHDHVDRPNRKLEVPTSISRSIQITDVVEGWKDFPPPQIGGRFKEQPQWRFMDAHTP